MREHFRYPEGVIYFDSAATTQKPLFVIDAVRDYLSSLFVNPGRGGYGPSRALSQSNEETRKKVANFIHACSSDDIVFTSGATHGLNTIAYSWGFHHLKTGDEILLCREDHASTVLPWYHLQSLLERAGIQISIHLYERDPYSGKPNVAHLKSLVNEKTKLVVVTHIHNIFGTKADLPEIRKVIGESPLYVIDASQSIAHTEVDVQASGADFLVFSGHKMFALEGIGVLYIAQRVHHKLHPFVTGGQGEHKKENNSCVSAQILEAGTVNSLGIRSLGAAIGFIHTLTISAIEKNIFELTTYLYEQLSTLSGIDFLPGFAFDQVSGRYGIISFRINNISSSSIAEFLSTKSIYVRSGMHCSASEVSSENSLRVSLQIYNSKEEIDLFIQALRDIVT